MTIHFLVAAHHSPKMLSGLIDALSHGESRIYVHVDATVNEDEFRRAVPQTVQFVPLAERIDVTWAGWSQVEATLALLRLARGQIRPHDYVVLLSGDSYPLQSIEGIGQFLHDGEDRQYINSVRMPSLKLSKPISRISRLYVPYDPRNGSRNLLPRVINKVGLPRAYKRALRGRTARAGSNWWALTGSAVHWLLDEVERDLRFVRFCRWSKMPDEFFFQTLLGASPFAGNLHPALMFADFSRIDGPKPAFIDKAHIDMLRESSLVMTRSGYGPGVALFARKFRAASETDQARSLWAVTPASP